MSKKNVVKSSKIQFLESKRYKHTRDLISVLLEDGKQYSTDEVDKLIKGYMKGSVK